MATALIYDAAYHRHETGVHPESATRLDAILKTLKASPALWGRLEMLKPRPALDEDLVRCHDAALIETLRIMCERGEEELDADTRLSRESFDVARLAAGAAVTAVDYVMEEAGRSSFSLIRPPGHHATIRRAMGFCLFNNAAVAARYAQARHGVERVLIVDWDVHHGNGTQEIFYPDPTVFYFSTHQFPYYPGTGASNETGVGKGEGFTLNVPLRARTPASTHMDAFRGALKAIERKFPPDLIVISAGFDSRAGDPLGGLLLEDRDFEEMTRLLQDLADRTAKGRLIGLLEGGYGLDLLGGSVRSHISALLS